MIQDSQNQDSQKDHKQHNSLEVEDHLLRVFNQSFLQKPNLKDH